jgi:hypothetical protein
VTASTLVPVFLSSESDVTIAVEAQKRKATTLIDANQLTECLQSDPSVLQLCDDANMQLCIVPLGSTLLQRSVVLNLERF